MTSAPAVMDYPATLTIDYPDRDLDRVSTAFRPIYALPIVILIGTMTGILAIPALLMIVFRHRYPRWFYDFNLQLTRLSTRASSYVALMSDEYPSADEDQNVHLELEYPDVERDLNRWLPLIKWFLAIPHYIVLTSWLSVRSSASSAPGSRSCSPAAIRAASSTSSRECNDGRCVCRPTPG